MALLAATALLLADDASSAIVFTAGDVPMYRQGTGNGAQGAFTDIDNDGDVDCVAGRSDGTITLFRNVGQASLPTFRHATPPADPFFGIDVGSSACPALIDIDNDGDIDCFIGNDDGCVLFFENIGSASSPVFVERTGSGSSFTGVDVGMLAQPTFVDIDNDGDADCFVGENDGIVNFFENTGTATAPIFTERTGGANPLNGVDVGYGSAPTFADIDGDGDYDCYIGNTDGYGYYYENTGTATVSLFVARTGSADPFDGFYHPTNCRPVFADIDDDGDADVLAGTGDGTFHYHENVGTATNPQFTIKPSPNFGTIDVGSNSTPAFVDIDNDGDLDCFVGEDTGIVNYLQNTGTPQKGVYVLQTGSSNPMNGVDVGTDSAPTFVDIDDDGDFDCFVGGYSGSVAYYENVGSADAASMVQRTGTANPLAAVAVGGNAVPVFVDIDNDGDLDFFVGELNGPISFFENTGKAYSPVFTKRTGDANPFTPYNTVVAGGLWSVPFFVDIDSDGDYDCFVGTFHNTVRFFENVGNTTTAVFAERLENAHPLNGSEVSEYNRLAPAFVDIDADGDMDCLFGNNYGNMRFVENAGSAANPVFTTDRNPLARFSAPYAIVVPSFVDIDSDGDMDCFAGDSNGEIYYYKNTGTVSRPAFAGQWDNIFPIFPVDDNAAPTFADIDDDGDMDAFVGDYNGLISYFENIGTPEVPDLIERRGTANPFNGVDVGYGSGPVFGDIDGDGDMDCFMGVLDGEIAFFENTGTAQVCSFTPRTGSENPLSGVDTGSFPSLVDIDHDGDLDCVLGGFGGTLRFYENTGTVTAAQFVERTGSANPFDGFDFGFSAAPAFVDIDGDGYEDCFVGLDYDRFEFLRRVPPLYVATITPAGGSAISTSSINVDITFSAAAVGVDVGDLVLGGSASAGASVGMPTDQGANTWRFPVSGLVSGNLNISLAPDVSDIEDLAGNNLAPRPSTWTYTVSIITGGCTSATYTEGDISADYGFQSLPGASGCPGILSVSVPAGAVVTGVDVAYTMTALGGGTSSEQRSQLRCVSTGGTSEAALSSGVGGTSGTYSYSRTGLTLANGVSGGGNIQFELHAGRTGGDFGCSTTRNRVDNNSWTVTVCYTIPPVSGQPGALTIPSANATGSYKVAWGASSTTGATYVLEEATNSSFTTGLRIVYAGASTGVYIMDRTNATYYYRVKATKSGYTDSVWTTGANGCVVTVPVSCGQPGALTIPATNTTGSYAVSWGASITTGVTYVLEEATNSSFTTGRRTAYSGTGMTASITSRHSSVTYHYRVKATKSGYSDSVWLTGTNGCIVAITCVQPGTLSAPTTNTTGSYTVSWGASSTTGVTYVLEEATNSSYTTGLRIAYSGTSTSVSIEGRSNGVTYYYRAKAVKSGYIDSDWRTRTSGCVVTIYCGQPTSLTKPTTNTTGNYTVSWGASSTTGATYVLEEATNSSFTAGLRTAYNGTSISASITDRTSATYYYRVKAIKTGYSDSAWLTGASGCVVTVTCGQPGALTIPTTNTTGSYTVSWGASSTTGVTYVLEEATTSGFTTGLRTAYSGLSTSASIIGRASATYYYRVKATKTGYTNSAVIIGTNGCAVTLTCGQPGALTIPIASTTGSYAVFWGASSTTGVTYVLEEATNSSFTAGLRTAYNGTSTGASIAGRSNGVSYYYRVKAIKIVYSDSAWQTGANGCTVDNTAPTVSAVEVQTGSMVDVTFSESMGTGATALLNYAVSGAGRGTLDEHPAAVTVVGGTTKTYRLEWTSHQEMVNGESVVITVSNAQDVAGNGIGAPNSGSGTGIGVVADAGHGTSLNPMNVKTGAHALLNASGSYDPDGDMLHYGWSLVSAPSGSSCTMLHVGSVRPSLAPDLTGEYVLQLVVDDGYGNSATTDMTLLAGDNAVTADAGPDQSGKTGAMVVLDGGRSIGTGLTYAWSFESVAPFSGIVDSDIENALSETPSFTPDVAGTYTLLLSVSGATGTDADTVEVHVVDAGAPPNAHAGLDRLVEKDASVELDGLGSSDPNDPSGVGLGYSWWFVSEPSGSTATLDNAAIAKPKFTPNKSGYYVVGLRVSSVGGASTDTVLIQVLTDVRSVPVTNVISDKRSALDRKTRNTISMATVTATGNQAIAQFRQVLWVTKVGPGLVTMPFPWMPGNGTPTEGHWYVDLSELEAGVELPVATSFVYPSNVTMSFTCEPWGIPLE